jgi:hypothetical protein
MEEKSRSRFISGAVLVLLGILFLAIQLIPGLSSWIRIEYSWPLIIIGVGVMLLLLGLIVNAPGMAVPACIVGGIGGLLYYQNLTGDWESWAYAWALIPGFVGIGTILMGLLGHDTRKSLEGGIWLVLISLVLYAIFGSFLGGINVLGKYWPTLLILMGLLMLIRPLFKQKG